MPDRRPAPIPRPERRIVVTDAFRQWAGGLSAEIRADLAAAIERIAETGPTLGRPAVDRIHGSRVHKLKVARLPDGVRALFAFDSRQNVVMLTGGNKTGQWNRWYPAKIQQAERLYADHERTMGKEAAWRNARGIGRSSSDLGP